MHSEILERLQSSDVEQQREGAFQAAETRLEPAVPLLVELLGSYNLGVQDAADHALRRIGGRRAVESLLPLLRDDQAPLRNLGMDLLRALGGSHLDLMLPLLKDEDPDIRIFMADILGSASDVHAVQPLCEALLRDPEVNVRYQAAVSLGELGRPEAVRSLNQALGDEEWVRFSVIEALMKIRDEASINALVRALDRSSDLVGSMIIDALGEMGNVKAVPMLMKRLDTVAAALRNKILRAIVRIMGGRSLSLLSADEREKIGHYLLAALDDEDTEIQDAAVVGLGHVGGAKATSRILNLAGGLDPDHDLERVTLAVNSLAAIGINPALEAALQGDEGGALVAIMALDKLATPEASRLLIAAFDGLGRDLQRCVSATIARIGGPETKDYFLGILAESRDGTILKQALHFLGRKLRCGECAEAVLTHLDHPYDDVKEAALEAAVAIGNAAVTARMLVLINDSAVLRRLMGVYGLGRIDPQAHQTVLVAALSDESPDVRKIALESMGPLMHDPRVLDAMLGLAEDGVAEVRQTLVETLGRVCSGRPLDFLLGALGDKNEWVRIRAVDALADCQDPSLAPAIIGLLEDPNPLVVVKVIAALGRIGGQSAFKALLAALNSDDPDIQAAAEHALDRMQTDHGREG